VISLKRLLARSVPTRRTSFLTGLLTKNRRVISFLPSATEKLFSTAGNFLTTPFGEKLL
jgi:hypothetical protein